MYPPPRKKFKFNFRITSFFLFNSGYLLLGGFFASHADILTFKNGKVLENVKILKISKTAVEVSLDGKNTSYPKSLLKGLRLKPVVIKTTSGEKNKEEYEKEKIRIAESLQQAVDTEIDQERKLRVAVLNFRAGTGVEAGEAETIAELVTNSLVRTKLFIVVDKSTVEKAIKDNAALCATGSCDNASLGSFLNSSKMITGTVTKIGKKYFINGNIVDNKKNQIDFAETAEAENPDKFPEAADYFAKKAAGGITDYADIGFSSTDKENKSVTGNSNLPYLARSAVVPGWGQWKKRDKVKGVVIFSSTILGLGFLLKANLDFAQNKNTFEKSNSLGYLSFVSSTSGIGFYSYLQTSEARSALETNANQIRSASLFLLAVYIYNLADAYFAKDKSKEVEPIKAAFIFNIQNQFSKTSATQSETNYLIGYQWRF